MNRNSPDRLSLLLVHDSAVVIAERIHDCQCGAHLQSFSSVGTVLNYCQWTGYSKVRD